MIIDFHTHIFPPEVAGKREKYLDDENFALLYGSASSRMVTGEELIALMDRTEVDCAVCMGFPWKNERYRAMHNGYISRVARESGGRIIPFMSMPLATGEDPVPHARALKALGAKGIGEISFYAGGFGEEEGKYLARLLAAAKEEGLPVCLHVNEPVGHRYAGKYEPSLGRLFDVLSGFPGFPVVLSHWGGGLFFYELMPEVKRVLAGVYYDTAASPFIYGEGVYAAARDIIGPERILFGTDSPLLEAGRYLPSIKKFFTGDDVGRITGGNAREFLGL